MPRLRIVVPLLLATSLVTGPPAVAAKNGKKAAKRHLKSGNKLLKAGDFAGALAEFLESNKSAPNPKAVKAVVKAYERLDDIKGSAAFLRAVIDTKSPKKAVKWATKQLAGYADRLAAIAKAEEEARKKAEAEAAAKREAEAAARKKEAAAAAAKKAGASTPQLAIDPDNPFAIADEEPLDTTFEEEGIDWGAIAAWSSLGIAVGALGSGTFFQVRAFSKQAAANACALDAAPAGGSCGRDVYDGSVADANDSHLFALISWGVALAGGTTAAVMLMGGDEEGGEDAAEEAPAKKPAPATKAAPAKKAPAKKVPAKKVGPGKKAPPVKKPAAPAKPGGKPKAMLQLVPGGVLLSGTF